MAHLSRPYQIALVALLVVAIAWVGLAHRHSSGSEPGSSSSSAQSSSSPATASAGTSTGSAAGAPAAPGVGAAEEKSAAAPSAIYHGSAPGVEGLSRAVAKAHEAVAVSQSNAKTLESKSAQASGEGAAPASTAPASSSSSSGGSSSSASSARSSATTTPSTATTTKAKAPTSARVSTKPSALPTSAPSGQRAVEQALAHGKVAVVLFWNPLGADDDAVRAQVRQVAHSRLPVAVFEGSANSVANYGTITRQVPVYATPTILVVAKNGQTSVLTGLQEHFAIEQAIEEARAA